MTQVTLPPSGRTVGSVDPPGDMNLVSAALAAMSATSCCTPTGDGSGVTDAANINAAVTATGVAVLSPGTYYLNATIGPMVTGQWVICMPGVFINWKGTGDCFRWVDTSTYTTRTKQGAGILGRPIIDGTSDGAGSSALHAGDILGFRYDIAAQNFSKSGDIGVHLDNQNYWTEQAIGVAYIHNCATLAVLDCSGASTSTGSYDRADLTFYVSQPAGSQGVVLQNGAQLVGGRLRIFGNVASSTSPLSTAVLTFTGSTPGGHSPATDSGLAQCELDINVESDGGHTYTTKTISYGGTSNVAVNCSGNVSFGPGNQFTHSDLTTVSAQFAFLGPIIGDAVLAEVNIPTRLTVSSSVTFFSQVAMQKQTLLEEVATPGTPVGGGYLYVDLTGHLVYKGPSGTVTTLANP